MLTKFFSDDPYGLYLSLVIIEKGKRHTYFKNVYKSCIILELNMAKTQKKIVTSHFTSKMEVILVFSYVL